MLTASGLTCGHEAWWNPLGVSTPNLLGDSSWCATGDLDGFDGRVFHQVRDPLATVASFLAVPLHSPYDEVSERIAGQLPDDPLERAIATYVRLNEIAEDRAEMRWQVERVTAELVVEVGRRLCIPVSWAGAALAIASTPTSLNQHASERRLTWEALPPGHWTERLVDMAKRYDYEGPWW